MSLANFNLCRCGEIFRTYFCKKCQDFQEYKCKYCHEEHFDQIKRMKNLSRLKRGIGN